MAIRRARNITFRPRGLSDALDGTNADQGAMAALTNLVPAPSTAGIFVPRPAAASKYTFGDFTTPTGVTALLVVGSRAYGMLSSGDFAGRDEPFCYDFTAASFVAITGPASANLPLTQSTSGDWTPPTMAMISNSRILVTHPGFPGSGIYFGIIDISGFSSNTITGDTHSNKTVDTLSANPITSGWQVGMTVSSSAGDIPGGTRIVALTSTSVTLSAAATGTNAGVTLTVAGGTAAAPLWASGNLSGAITFTSVPVAVANFNSRAYWATGNAVVYSDTLNPANVTNANQALTLGDTQAVTALAGLPLSSPITGGVIQSLIAFKGDAQMFQITGDAATSNLSLNSLNEASGTLAPNTICATPNGLAFVAPDGVRLCGFDARISEPLGIYGKGVVVPFINAVHPSRMCAAYNQNVLRISVINGAKQNTPLEEYWYDFTAGIWTGPHSFPSNLIAPYQQASNGFIQVPNAVPASLFFSNPLPTPSASFTENGVALSWNWQTSLLPDMDELSMNAIIESAIAISLPSGQTVTAQWMDDSGALLDTVSINGASPAGGVWGSFNWGAAMWGSSVPPFRQVHIPWHQPLVFKQGSLSVSGNSATGVAVGNLYLGMQILQYILMAS